MRKRSINCKWCFTEDDNYACYAMEYVTGPVDDPEWMEAAWGCKSCNKWKKAKGWTKQDQKDLEEWEE